MIHSKEDIKQALKQSYHQVVGWYENQPLEKFNTGLEGKWVSSQHLDHLFKSAKLLNKALRLPKFIIRYKFGKPNRPLRNYDQLVHRYEEKLDENPGIIAPLAFHPAIISFDQKDDCLQKYRKQSDLLAKILDRWPEASLNNYLLPHPLLGRLMIREMYFFTIHHNYHHLGILKEKYS